MTLPSTPPVARIAIRFAVCLLLAPWTRGLAQVPLPAFLEGTIGLSAGQVRDAGRGAAVVRVLDTKNERDVVLFGIVAIDVPRAFYVDRLKEFGHSLRMPGRTGFGLFGSPASAADVDAMVITPGDLALLRGCRPGACDFKLPATDMANARAILDSSGSGGAERLLRYARSRIAEYVNGYRERGADAMLVYDDDAKGGVRAGEAFAELLAESPYFYDYVPAFHQYLVRYPGEPLDGVAETIFWARDEVPSLRPTLTINHMVVLSPPERPDATVVAVKQIFADHYFEAALDLFVAVDRPVSADRQGMYLVLLRQYRFDNLPSGGLLSIRGRAVGRLRDRADAELRRAKQDYERAFKQSR